MFYRMFLPFLLFVLGPEAFASTPQESWTTGALTMHGFSNVEDARSYCSGSMAYADDSSVNTMSASFAAAALARGYVYRNYCLSAPNNTNPTKYVVYVSLGSDSSPEQACTDEGKYWYNNECHVKHPVCNSYVHANEVKPFSGSGPSAPSSICFDTGIANTSCRFNQSGSPVFSNGGILLWAGNYVADGHACSDTSSQPAPHVCDTITITLDVLESAAVPPTEIGSGLCNYLYDGVEGVNPVNGCKRYKYKGIENTIGDVTPTYSSFNQCNYNEEPADPHPVIVPPLPEGNAYYMGISDIRNYKTVVEECAHNTIRYTPDEVSDHITQRCITRTSNGGECTPKNTGISVGYDAGSYDDYLFHQCSLPVTDPEPDPDPDPDPTPPPVGDCDPSKELCPVHISEQTTQIIDALKGGDTPFVSNGLGSFGDEASTALTLAKSEFSARFDEIRSQINSKFGFTLNGAEVNHDTIIHIKGKDRNIGLSKWFPYLDQYHFGTLVILSFSIICFVILFAPKRA